MKTDYLRLLVIGNSSVEGQPLVSLATQCAQDVLAVDTLEEGLAVLGKQPIQVILLDQTQPQLSGLDTLTALKHKQRQTTPIIAILENHSLDTISKCLEAGADDYLPKPFNAAMLKQRLEVYAERAGMSEFMSAFAHDLLVLITSIKGFSDLLLRGNTLKSNMGTLNELQKDFIERIRDNSERASKLIQNQNDVARIENRTIPLMLEPVVIPTVLDDVLKTLRPELEKKSVAVALEIPADLPSGYANYYRVREILMTLLDNARQYAVDGGHVSVKAQTTERAVQVSVQDDGFGIHEKERDKIFQKFYRSLEDDRVREYSGNGLSLYIAKHFVEQLGGRIWFESEMNKGSTFHFTLPVVE
jgi:signal transduction histidine kinase